MAIIDVDRHILTELSILSEKIRVATLEYKIAWEDIVSVKDKTEILVLDMKIADHPELPRLRDKIVSAIKVCNTKMTYIDDCLSRQRALLNHLVSEVIASDSGKGKET